VLEYLETQHGVDAVARVQDQVLTHPGHGGAEYHEHRQPDADHGEGIQGVVHDHLVDDDLGEQGGGERHQLDGKGSHEDVAEYLAVLEQFGDEPTEAEMRARG
jgi:hypothetical protein